MECYFCKSSNHLSENCDVYSTLQSRYSYVGYCRKYCLCNNFGSNEFNGCGCKAICDACLQEHHAAFCPKQDPSHPSFVSISDKNVIELDTTIWRRFLVLCNPITKIKLQLTCKSLFSLQQEKSDYKLRSIFNSRSLKPNVIYNGYACITKKENLEALEKQENVIFNLEKFYLIYRNISKADVKILSRSDPVSVHLSNCEFVDNLLFFEFVNAFPYCIDFSFSDMHLPRFWMKDLILVNRKVSIKTLLSGNRIDEVACLYDEYYEYLIKLFQQNEDLKLTYVLDIQRGTFKIIYDRLQQLGSINPSDKDNYNLMFKLYDPVEIEQGVIHHFYFNATRAQEILNEWKKLFQSTSNQQCIDLLKSHQQRQHKS